MPIPEITEDFGRLDCLDLMLELECFELPVLKNGKVHAKVRLEDCLNSESKTIKDFIELGCPFVLVGSHLFDVIHILNTSELSVCAVLDEEMNMLGVITKHVALNRMARSISIEQAGAVIIIEMASHQYSSSEIARIIESENAQLLGLWMESVPESSRIRVSLKINTSNAERIINSLTRFNYEVIATYGDLDYKEKVEKRYQALMKYLDI